MTAAGPIGERHSPHTSPHFSRRSTTPSLMAVQNDLYASTTITALSLSGVVSSGNRIVPNSNVANGFGGEGSIASAAEKSYNRMSAPLIGSGSKQLSINNNNSHTNSNSSENAPWIYGQRVTETYAVPGPIPANKETNTTYSALLQCQESMGMKHITSVVPSTKTAHTSLSTTIPNCRTETNSSTIDMQPIQQAPPLPPRKSSPGVSECSFQQSLNSSGVINKIYGCTDVTLNASSPSKSLDNFKTDSLDMASKTGYTATPSNSIITHSMGVMIDDMRQLGLPSTPCITPVRSILDEDIEVGPAETIMGVIDTRPLEVRKLAPTLVPQNSTVEPKSGTEINLTHCVTASPHYIHISATTSQASTLSVVTNHGANNLDIYLQQRNQLHFLQQQQRLQRYYQQLQQLQKQSDSVKQLTHPTQLTEQIQDQHQQHLQQPNHNTENSLLYENVTINPKDCSNVPYENVNLEYVSRLISDGYTKEHAISALVISRNNIEMACEILREFASKSSF